MRLLVVRSRMASGEVRLRSLMVIAWFSVTVYGAPVGVMKTLYVLGPLLFGKMGLVDQFSGSFQLPFAGLSHVAVVWAWADDAPPAARASAHAVAKRCRFVIRLVSLAANLRRAHR